MSSPIEVLETLTNPWHLFSSLVEQAPTCHIWMRCSGLGLSVTLSHVSSPAHSTSLSCLPLTVDERQKDPKNIKTLICPPFSMCDNRSDRVGSSE